MANWKAEDGTSINFEVHGEGHGKENLLLLPGILGAISSDWRPFVDLLAADFRVIMIDFRGHGLSTNTKPALRPEHIVDDIIGLLEFLGVRTVHIAGYSLGGYIGMLTMLKDPRRVQTLLMLGTKFYWNAETVEKMQKQFDPNALSEQAPTYATQLAQEHGGSRWRALVRQTADLIGLISQDAITERMVARIQAPVLVSVGDHDSTVPLVECARLSHILPKGGLFVLPHTRHPFSTIRPVPLIPMMRSFHRPSTRR